MALNINKKGLGRGLSSLMGDTDNQHSTNPTSSSETKISIAKLRPSPLQPRRVFDKNSITDIFFDLENGNIKNAKSRAKPK